MASFASRALRRYLHAQRGYARDVAAWTVKAGDEADLRWIVGGGEDNGNRSGRGFYRQHSRCIGDDHSHLTTNQLSRREGGTRAFDILDTQPPTKPRRHIGEKRRNEV